MVTENHWEWYASEQRFRQSTPQRAGQTHGKDRTGHSQCILHHLVTVHGIRYRPATGVGQTVSNGHQPLALLGNLQQLPQLLHIQHRQQGIPKRSQDIIQETLLLQMEKRFHSHREQQPHCQDFQQRGEPTSRNSQVEWSWMTNSNLIYGKILKILQNCVWRVKSTNLSLLHRGISTCMWILASTTHLKMQRQENEKTLCAADTLFSKDRMKFVLWLYLLFKAVPVDDDQTICKLYNVNIWTLCNLLIVYVKIYLINFRIFFSLSCSYVFI